MSWTIQGGGFAEPTAFPDAKISAATRQLSTGGGDVCNVVLDLAFDDASIAGFSILDVVTITNGSGVFFSGPLAKISPGGSVASESVVLEIRSWWWLLERITYTQDYKAFDGTTGDPPIVTQALKQKSRVVLGRFVDGTPITTGAQIAAILEFANSLCGDIIPVGSVMTGIVAPPVEMVDASCAECILTLLRIHPDALVFCDYNGASSGEVNVVQRGSLDTLTLAASGDDSNAIQVQLSSCPELSPPGVAIHYELTHFEDGVGYTDIQTDEAPSAGAASAVGGIHFTVPLEGRNVTTQKQEIKCGAIPDVGDTGAAAWKWIQSHFAGFLDEDADDYIIGQGSFAQELMLPEDADPEDYPDSYPRELVSGVIPEHVADPDGDGSGDPVACSTTVKVFLTYKGANAARRKDFAPTGKRVFSTEVLGTDLHTRTYSKITGFSDSPPVPEGLAAAYYGALTTLQAQGSISIQADEVDLSLAVGRILVLTSGPSASGQSIIQQVTQDVFNGTSNLVCGPFNESLTPSDWLELQRGMTRTMQLSYAPAEERDDARVGSAKNELGGTHAVPRNNDVSPPAPFPPLYFLAQKISATQVKVEPGLALGESGNAVAAEVTLTVAAGDKLYAKLTQTTCEVVKFSSPPTDTDTIRYVPIADIESDGDSGWDLTQRHVGVLHNPMVPDDSLWFRCRLSSTSVICGAGIVYDTQWSSTATATKPVKLLRSTDVAAATFVTLADAKIYCKLTFTRTSASDPIAGTDPETDLQIRDWQIAAASIVRQTTTPTATDTEHYWLVAEVSGGRLLQRHVGAINMGSTTLTNLEEPHAC